MTNADFKVFKERVFNKEWEDYIKCCGYLWLRLTEKQAKEIAFMFRERGELKENENKKWYTLGNTPWVIKKELID